MSTRQRRRRPWLGLVAVVASTGVLAAACGLDESTEPDPSLISEDSPRQGGSLVAAVPAESNGWNPVDNQWTDSGTLAGTMMIEPMVIQDRDGNVQPWLAERWEPAANFTQWTITMRPGVYFHDGTLMDAAVVKRVFDSSLKSGLHQVSKQNPIDGVEVVGPLQVRIQLRNPWAQFPTSLASEWVLGPSMLDRADHGVSNPVGTGPFQFVSWTQGKSLKMRRFGRYWRRDAQNRPLPYLEGLEVRPIPDDKERETALRTRQVDLALSGTTKIVNNLQDDFTVIKDYTSQRTYLMLNVAEGPRNKGNPFRNVHARRALAYATDRRRMTELMGEGVQSTTYGYRPDSRWAPSGSDGYVQYDPAKARAEIDRYRQDTGARDLSFTVLGQASGESLNVLQALKAMWAEVGIKAETAANDPAQQMLLTVLGTYHAGWIRFHDFPDPDQNSFLYAAANISPIGEMGINFTRYTSRRLEDNLKVIRESTDPNARKAANDDVIREANEQATNIWLYDTPESIVAAPYVQGLDGFRNHAIANSLPKPWLAETWINR